MADLKAAAEAARAEDQKLVQRSREEYHQRMKGRPTPSQLELDTIKLGGGTIRKSPSGADPLPARGTFGRQATSPPRVAQERQVTTGSGRGEGGANGRSSSADNEGGGSARAAAQPAAAAPPSMPTSRVTRQPTPVQRTQPQPQPPPRPKPVEETRGPAQIAEGGGGDLK